MLAVEVSRLMVLVVVLRLVAVVLVVLCVARGLLERLSVAQPGGLDLATAGAVAGTIVLRQWVAPSGGGSIVGGER